MADTTNKNWDNYGIKITDSYVLDPESENAVVIPDGVGASTVGAFPLIAQTIADSAGNGDVVEIFPDSWRQTVSDTTNLDTDHDYLRDSEEVQDDFVASLAATLPAKGAAVDGDTAFTAKVPQDGHVVSVTLTSVSAVAADGTNNRTFAVKNGANTVATFTTSSQSLVAGTPKALTLSGTASNLVVKEGDVLHAVETHSGSGVAHTGYSLAVRVEEDSHVPTRDHQ